MQLRVGIDIGGTKFFGVAIDESGQLIARRRAATPIESNDVVNQIAEFIEDFSKHGTVQSVGLGMPGAVDLAGVLRSAPNLPCMIDVPTIELLSKRYPNISFQADNDATCALRAELAVGAAHGAKSVMLVTLGTGIGGAIAANGNVVAGAHGYGGEPGHMVINPDGPLCVCGRHGCWERYASGAGLSRLIAEASLDCTNEELVQRASDGDDAALAIFSNFAQWVGLGLGNLINIFDPELIVVGGGLSEASEFFLAAATETALAHTVGPRTVTKVVVAQLGSESGAIGAAWLH